MSETLAIMPTFIRSQNDFNVTAHAIGSFLNTCDQDLLVVDDHSPNLNLVEALEDMGAGEERVSFEFRPTNDGFAKTVNMGLRRARRYGQNALLVNADIEFMDNGWYERMIENSADVVGALLLYPNGLVQHAGVFYSIITRRFDHRYRQAPRTLAQVSDPCRCPVTGALMLIRHNTMKRVGILDENFKMGFEDVDYCHMVFQAGMECAYEPQAVAIHHESLFRRRDPSKRLQDRSEESWHYLHEKHKGMEIADFVPTMIWDEEG